MSRKKSASRNFTVIAPSAAPDTVEPVGVMLVGKAPQTPPPRVVDYDELDKKSIDVLVDALKYIATTCGIVIAVYSQATRDYVKDNLVIRSPAAQTLVFAPLVLWFLTIVTTVIGIYPRRYAANTDVEKENAILELRGRKQRWLTSALAPFLTGFALFLYIIGAQIWRVYPFR